MLQSYKIESTENSTDVLLNYLKKYFNCDLILAFNYTEDSAFITIDEILSVKDIEPELTSKLSKVQIDNFYKKLLKQSRHENSIIYLKNDNTIHNSIFDKNSEDELFIPMQIEKNSITFIYLCSLHNNKCMNVDFISKVNFKPMLYCLINIYKSLYKRREFTFELINILTKITKEREPMLVFHPYNVADISKKIAIQLKLSSKLINKIYFAGLLHDIGKLYINKNTLNKTGKLTKDEYNLLKKHSTYGYNLLKNLYPDIAIYIKHHHEKIDGSGYPYNLKGKEIPLESKIISVADAIDAMQSSRSYNTPKNMDASITELLQSTNQFDSEVVNAAVTVLMSSKRSDTYNLDNEIEWSTITITTQKEFYSTDGILRRTNYGYRFISNQINFSSDINVVDIQSINLYICKSQTKIYQYGIFYSHFTENILYIKDINQIKSNDSFNIEWILQGILVFQKLPINKISIFKLGGNSLMFYFDINIKKYYSKEPFYIKINFNDNENVLVEGFLTQLFKSNSNYYYEFKYTNIPETTREKIFKKIFEKQTQINKVF